MPVDDLLIILHPVHICSARTLTFVWLNVIQNRIPTRHMANSHYSSEVVSQYLLLFWTTSTLLVI